MSELHHLEKEHCAEEAPSVAVRPCTEDDLATVAEIYKSQFRRPEGLSWQLSAPRIAELFRIFLRRSVFLVHTTDGAVDGFVIGARSATLSRHQLSFICRHPMFCILKFVLHPHLWHWAIRSLAKMLNSSLSFSHANPSRERFCMLAIAVHCDATRKGVGTALVRAFEAAVSPTYRQYSLHVLKGNLPAIRFYERLGFKRVGETAVAWRLSKVVAASASMPEKPLHVDS